MISIDIPNSYYFCSFRCIHFQQQPLLVTYLLTILIYFSLFFFFQTESYGYALSQKMNYLFVDS